MTKSLGGAPDYGGDPAGPAGPKPLHRVTSPSLVVVLTGAPINQDITSHRVFKIGELTRLIASQLVSISQRSAVNLACACRCLEEPVLSTLWETQPLLYTLLMTLPEDTWGQWGNVEYNRIEV